LTSSIDGISLSYIHSVCKSFSSSIKTLSYSRM
jgi:hypothetical protein